MPRYALFKDGKQITGTYSSPLTFFLFYRFLFLDRRYKHKFVLLKGWDIKEVPEVDND